MASVAGLLFGALAPALVFAALSHEVGLLVPAFLVTSGHALAFGLPAVLLFFYKRWTHPAASVVAGFVIGALPIGIVAWPLDPASGMTASGSGGPTVVNGIPTWLGWLEYLEFAGHFGLFGAFGALVFWVTLDAFGALPADG